jgi:hypothetical protein
MRGRRVGEGEDMTGKSPTGKGIMIWGRKNYGERRDCSSGLGILAGSVVGFWVFG